VLVPLLLLLLLLLVLLLSLLVNVLLDDSGVGISHQLCVPR
jgi:hypothetical protein